MLMGLASLWLEVGVLGYGIYLCVADARRRGKPPILVCFPVIFCFPLGTVLWLLLRPEPIDRDRPRRSFRLEDHRQQ